jgi:hypothetical protein
MALEYLKNIVTAPARLGAKLPEIGEKIGEFVGNEIYGTGLTADGEKTGRMLGPNNMAASPTATPVPMLGNTPQVAPEVSNTPTPQAQQLSQPQALGGAQDQAAPVQFGMQGGYTNPLAAGIEMQGGSLDSAQNLQALTAPEPIPQRTSTGGSGLTTVGGTPLAQFLSGAAIPEAGLVAERQLAGRGETLTPEQFNQLSAERQSRMGSLSEPRGPDSRGLSIRDANGMTQGDRRNILRERGIGGSAQVALARQMGNQAGGGTIRPEMNPQEQADIKKTEAETAKILSSIEQKGDEIGLTEADKARDKKFGAELAQWEISGRANTQANIEALDQIVDGLDSGQINTRGWVDSLPFAQDWARAIVNPTGQDALDRVRGVVFQSLRETLGAQFTEREGQRFVEASYNPKLDEKQNSQRLKDYASRLKSAQEAKNQQLAYLKSNGTLQGYTGQDPEKIMLSGLEGEKDQSPIKGDIDVLTAADDILANQ